MISCCQHVTSPPLGHVTFRTVHQTSPVIPKRCSSSSRSPHLARHMSHDAETTWLPPWMTSQRDTEATAGRAVRWMVMLIAIRWNDEVTDVDAGSLHRPLDRRGGQWSCRYSPSAI